MNPETSALIPPAAEPRVETSVQPRSSVSVPRHVAIVNGTGSQQPTEAARGTLEVIHAAIEHGVGCLSLCLGSEAGALDFLRAHGGVFARNGVRITVQAGASAEVCALIDSLVLPAPQETLLRLHLLLDASGCAEMDAALERLARKVQDGELDPESLTREAFERELDADKLPPVDLLLHSADAPRLSRMLLWKAAYAELFFSRAPWHSFRREHFAEALADYAQRRRTFGGLK
ncbi:MAG TPA: undecaprenyl diphosphate synthase family protein [Planctomycetota bacterium]|nr:undecaprenyl diphosphate synthase family protein [Planctomycetota bacterium]